jgi:hypothetical protein
MGCRRGAYWVWWGNVRERGYLEDVDINATIILKWVLLKWVFNMWYGRGIDWVDLAEDRYRWRALLIQETCSHFVSKIYVGRAT